MLPKDFDEFRIKFNAECEEVLGTKGRDYADLKDRLRNFKEVATALGMHPLQVWAVYFYKHLSAIFTYVKEGQVHSEPIRGRFKDARNYLDLGLALIVEEIQGRKLRARGRKISAAKRANRSPKPSISLPSNEALAS